MSISKVSTSTKLIENFSFLFPQVVVKNVNEIPQFRGINFNSWQQNCIVIDTPKGNHIGGFCSENYALIKNEDIFLPIADKLDSLFGSENVNIKIKYSKPFEYHLYFEMPNLGTSEIDSLYPMSQVQNSYTTQIRAMQMGMIGRLICSNGMMSISESMQVFNIKHTTKEKNQFLDIAEILANTEKMFNEFDATIEFRDILKEVPLNAIEGKNHTKNFEQIIKGTNFPKRQIDTAINLAKSEAIQLNSKVTLWLAYNALNHIIWHDTQSKMTEKMSNELDSKLVNRVHNFALELS